MIKHLEDCLLYNLKLCPWWFGRSEMQGALEASLLRNEIWWAKWNSWLHPRCPFSLFLDFYISLVLRNWEEVSFSGSHALPQSSVGWIPLPVCFYKLNFDGSTEGNLGLGGISGLICDWHAECIMSFFSLVGRCTLDEVKLSVLRTGLREAHPWNIRNFLFEGDSLCAIRWASG